MNCNVPLKKLKETARLEKLIKQNAPEEKILKQSQKLDRYVLIQYKQMNKYNNKQQKKLVGSLLSSFLIFLHRYIITR